MSIEKKEALEAALKLSIENRAFEIELLWKRTTIFWGFIAALFIAVSYAVRAHSDKLAFLLSLAGLVFSIIWTLANRASKAWQESWETKAEHYFEKLHGMDDIFDRAIPRVKNTEENHIFKKDTCLHCVELCLDNLFSRFKNVTDSHGRSLSRLLIILSDFSAFLWTVMTAYFLIKLSFPLTVPSILLWILLLVSIAYVLYVWSCTKSTSKIWPHNK